MSYGNNVSQAFGDGEITSIVAENCARFYLFLCPFFLYYFFLNIIFECFQETENEIGINKLEPCHDSQRSLVEASKLKMRKSFKKCNFDFYTEKFSVCWKRRR